MFNPNKIQESDSFIFPSVKLTNIPIVDKTSPIWDNKTLQHKVISSYIWRYYQ